MGVICAHLGNRQPHWLQPQKEQQQDDRCDGQEHQRESRAQVARRGHPTCEPGGNRWAGPEPEKIVAEQKQRNTASLAAMGCIGLSSLFDGYA